MADCWERMISRIRRTNHDKEEWKQRMHRKTKINYWI